MSMRCEEPGWTRVSASDVSGRRGIWVRLNDGADQGADVSLGEVAATIENRSINVLEVCGGREGDDVYVRLEVGTVLSEEEIEKLAEALDRERWMLEERCEREARWLGLVASAWTVREREGM